jgi:stearoyl-CoA desaturase (delta-9 desaturase)
MPFGALWTGVQLSDIVLCLALFWIRVFFITAGYHRYFSHRSYHLGRVMQFIMAFGGTTTVQKGVLWWAANHRHHHRYSDQEQDVHSPKRGFLWSHVGWILCTKYNRTNFSLIEDFAKYPELRWLNRWHIVPPILLATAVFLWGGWSALWIGFFLSTVLLWHSTFTINSLAHVFGRRRFVTTDTSRNSFVLALLTMGEGWHNNHHHYPVSANQGFFWWEVDGSYYVLKILSWFRLAKGLKKPSLAVLSRNLIKDGTLDIGMLKEFPAKAAQVLSANVQQARGALSEATQQAAQGLASAKRRASAALEDLSAPSNLLSSEK